MRNILVILTVCALVGGLVGMSYGQVGPDVYIPYVDPGRVTLDGLPTEWEDPTFYPQDFMMTRDDLGGNCTGGDMPPVDDWDGICYLGWSTPPDNMVYCYSRVTDDLLNDEAPRNGDSWRDDALEVMFDADNSGGNYREGYALACENAQQFSIRMTEAPLPPGPGDDNMNTTWFIFASADAAWMTQPEYFQAVLDYPEGRENITYAYEWKMALWDQGGASAEEAQRHTNQVGDVIGISLQWDDSDAELDERDDQPGTQGPEGNEAWTNADHFNDAYLVESPLYDVGPVSTAVEPTAWGAVKASFR
jgi:hypothetical protein